MRITVNSQLFAQELRLLDKIIAAKSPYPVLQNILFDADDTLRMTTTDLEIGLKTTCDAEIAEAGTLTLPSKKLMSIVEQLPNCDVEIAQDKAHVFLTAGAFKSRIQTLPAKDFPTTPDVEGDISTVPFAVLKQMIARTRYAIADKGTKFNVDGAFLGIAEDAAAMVTTNGKSLAMAGAPWRGTKKTSFVIPSKTLDVLASHDANGDIDISESDNHLFFSIGKRLLYSRMLDAKFPSYQRIIPKTNEHEMHVRTSAFAAVLRRVSLMSEDATSAITLHVSSNLLQIETQSLDMGDASEELDVTYSGPEISVKTNWKLLLPFLDAASQDFVVLKFKDNTSAILCEDGPNFLNVISVLRN